MDFKDMVFSAAKNGELHQLKELLDDKPCEDVSSLVSAEKNGATLLVMACRNGYLDVALYLVERCKADIEQVGCVTFGKLIVKRAPPLWCAAAAGHLNIVKMLIEHNASVNSATEDNRTALNASCSKDQFEIAKYLIQHGADIEITRNHGLTCLMTTCRLGYYKLSKYLLECGADTNRKTPEGNTALHFSAEAGNLDILKLLLESGAKSYCNSTGITPLLSAALLRHSQVVEYLVHYFCCTKQEKVNAFELLGSAFTRNSMEDMVKAFEFWKRALELRYEEGEFPLVKPTTRYPIALCIDATEVHTLQQLEGLVSDPDEMCIQALLVVDRILGPGHRLTIPFILNISRRYFNNRSFDRCMCLLMYAMDLQLLIQEPLNYSILEIISYLLLLFYYMTEKHLETGLFQNILQVFEKSLRIIERRELYAPANRLVEYDTSLLHNTLIVVIHILGLMCRMQPHLSIYESTELRKAAYKLVRLNCKGKNGWTLLHVACYTDTSKIGKLCPMIKFPFPEVVDLLLEVGAYPNAVDAANNTSLHVAAMNMPFSPAIFKALLNHGAHLDLCNSERKTPLQLVETIPFLDVYSMRYINLQCLSAQTIRKHGIAYEGHVHEKLREFLDSH